MELIQLKLVWQAGKLQPRCEKQEPVWRWDEETSLKNSFACFILCRPWWSYSFANHAWFAVDYRRIALGIFHPRDCSLSDKLWRVSQSVARCRVSWLQLCFSGFLEVNTADTCTVPTSTESITTAWTLTVTTRWAFWPNSHILVFSPV